MSPNKRKIFASDTSDEDDSFEHRRSSLRVNLSYRENLTDSGNGSLLKTDTENNERRANGVRIIKRLSRGKSTHERNRRSDSDNKDVRVESDTRKRAVNNDNEKSVRIKEGIQLKDFTINLEDIRIKERYLETSCKRLKDTIMFKTKQIFDRENELSIKTAAVLGSRENRFASIHNPNGGNETVMLDMTDQKEKISEEQYTYNLTNQEKKDQYFGIVTTPISDGQRSLEKMIDKSRLTQRRLFVEKDKQVKGQRKCRIIADIVLKKNLLLFKRMNESNSPILSGSNRRLSLLRERSRLRSQNQFENRNNTNSVHSVQNMDIEMPVVCSTFIEDNPTTYERVNNDRDVSHATTNKIISMEMTEIHGGIHMNKEHVSLKNINSNKYNENSKEEKIKEGNMERNKNASSLENVKYPNKITIRNNTAHLSCTDDQDVEIVDVDTVLPTQIITKTHNGLQAKNEYNSKTKCQNERRSTTSLSDSNDTIRSSLNVNTSLDTITEAGKARNVQNISYRMNDVKQNKAIINNKKSIISNNERESINTIRTSLQMNTSVDSIHKVWQRNNKNDKDHSSINIEYSSTENKETNDIDSLENISLIERLRNISMRNQISRNDNSRVSSKMRNEDKRCSSNSGDSYSYVEGTPYPISRSVLFKSQLKYKTQHLDDASICNSNSNLMNNEEKNDKTKNPKVVHETHTSIETQKITEADTITLEGTLSDNPFITQNQLTVIEDGTKSGTEERNIAVQDAECVLIRRGRRKLLPLHEISQCSINPIEERKCIPEKSTTAKRNKKLKQKLPKRKSIRSKNNTSSIKQDIVSKKIWSDSDDCDIPETKKKGNEKTRKPKKVVSKKINIKKFVDENVLNILKNNTQNKESHFVEDGDSLDDFVKCRMISSQWNKYKSQKIIIVTTGLSRGDKSLVKSIVKSLGAAEMDLNVSKRTTHVVSTGVRTVNLLRGIIRGCWLVTLEWVLKSLESNAWLDPEVFEMKHFSKAVQENRKDRQLFGFSYIPELFTTCGLIYVEHKTTVPCDTLKELIKTAGGHITENIKHAKIIIGVNGLKETWVIDSITTGELQLTKLYQRK